MADDTNVGVTVSAKNETSGPVKEAAAAFAELAQDLVDANEKVAHASEDAAGRHKKSTEDLEKDSGEHVGRAAAIWRSFTEHLKEDIERGFGEGLGKKLAEGVIDLGKEVLAFPFEALKKIGETILDSAKAEDNAYRSAKTLGTSAEFFTGLSFAAKESGADADALQTALLKLQTNVGEGSAKFAQWGLSFRNANGDLKDMETLLPEIAAKIASLDEPAAQAALAHDLLGKSSTNLLPLLRDMGEHGVDFVTAKARSMGITISDNSAKLGHEFTTSLGTTKEALEGVGRQVGDIFEPVLIAAFKETTSWVGELSKTVSKNQDTFRQLAKDGVLFAVDALKGAVQAIGFVQDSFRNFQDHIDSASIHWLQFKQHFQFGDEAEKTRKAIGQLAVDMTDRAGDTEKFQRAIEDTAHAFDDLHDRIAKHIDDATTFSAAEGNKGRSLGLTIGEIERQKKALKELEDEIEKDANIQLEIYHQRLRADAEFQKEVAKADKFFADEKKKSDKAEVDFKFEAQKEAFEDHKKAIAEQQKAQDEADKKAREGAKQTAKFLSNEFGSFASAVIFDHKNVAESFKKMVDDMIKKIVESGIEKLLETVFGAALGVGTGGAAAAPGIAGTLGSLLGFSQGGVVGDPVRMASGGILSGGIRGVDSIPVIAQEGEAFLSAPTTAAVRRELGVSGGAGSGFATGGVVTGGGGRMPVIQQNVLAFAGSRAQLRAFQRNQWGPDADLLKRRGY